MVAIQTLVAGLALNIACASAIITFSGETYFTPFTFAAGSECASQISANISCDPLLLSAISNQTQQTNEVLSSVCTTECRKSVAEWSQQTWKACTTNVTDDIKGFFNSSTPEKWMYLQYWMPCAQDLKNGSFCLSQDYQNTYLYNYTNTTATPAQTKAACNSTCLQQYSSGNWKYFGSFGNPLENVAQVCPKVDTSKFLLLQNISVQASSNTSITPPPAENNTDTANSNTSSQSTGKTAGASSIVLSSSLMGGFVLTVVAILL